MRIVIRTEQPDSGQKVGVERTLDAERLTLGRGTNQHVQLNDMRVALAHAEISLARPGPYEIKAKGASSVWINGAPSSGRRLNFNDVIDIGRYRLTILKPDLGTDLLLAVEEKHSARDEKARRLRQFKTRLEQTGLSQRRWAWLLFLGLLVPSLVIPTALRYGAHGIKPPDRIWQTGGMSSAHAHFGGDCSSCHGQAFERVKNGACAACHAGVRHHSDHAVSVAQAGLAQARCADCHHEHNGAKGMIPKHPAICTQCHAKTNAGFANVQLEIAADFSNRHPHFTARLPRYRNGAFTYLEVSHANNQDWYEETNLIYPHDKHLNAQGIDSPKGKKVLHCGDCHEADAGGISFKPIRMETHCAGCHRLDFDPSTPARVLPHAEPSEVVQIIRDFYAQQALSGGVKKKDPRQATQLRRMPGQTVTDESAHPVASLSWAEQHAAQAINDVFDRRVCSNCHKVEKNTDPELPWKIAAVAMQEHAFSAARFNHAAHKTETCESCHDAPHSSKSGDVLLPDISNCRQCHGDPGHADRVPSTCVTCHGFHIADARTMTPMAREKEKPP